MAKVGLVTSATASPAVGGRALLSKLHRECLEEILGTDLSVYELGRSATRSKAAALRGYIDGLDPSTVRGFLDWIAREGVSTLFVNGSNLGRLVREVKSRCPKVELLTFFHNAEAKFFLDSLHEHKSLHALGVLVANWRAERWAVRRSDRLIALSDRDSRMLARLYGRGATDILPIAMEDQLEGGPDPDALVDTEGYALFVGGAFYANRAGADWYAREVAPLLPIRTCIVGHGMETMKSSLERHGNIEVAGTVERLEPWYRRARIVVAPIFCGSGMKTKVAEALMFGKPIAGTPEAFSGFETIAAEAGWICETSEAFVAAIRRACEMPIKALDPRLRSLYQRDHSREATKRRLAQILAR